MKKTVSGITLTLLLMSMLTLAFNIQPAKSGPGTIYIRADGSIDPPTAPIRRIANTYTFTGNIYDSIVVERDNIIIDGASYTLQGTGATWSIGVDLSERTNIMVKNIHIENFDYGIYLHSSSNNNITECSVATNKGWGVGVYLYYYCSSNSITGNNLTNNWSGIQVLSSDNNNLSGNNITNNSNGIYSDHSRDTRISGNNITNNQYGIYDAYYVGLPSDTRISGNNITNNQYGIFFIGSDNNNVSGNNITNNGYSVMLEDSSNNKVYQNAFIDNDLGIYLYRSSNYNMISGNNVTNNQYGIYVHSSSNNNITECSVATNKGWGVGVYLYYSSSNSITGNNLTNNWSGIQVSSSDNNNVSGNNITNNQYGIWLNYSSYNKFYHNCFIDNGKQVFSDTSPNFWDDGYPSGGNYWSDYKERYPNAKELDGSGLWDTPYVIDEANQDSYPLIPEFPSAIIIPLFMVISAIAIRFAKKEK